LSASTTKIKILEKKSKLPQRHEKDIFPTPPVLQVPTVFTL